MNSFLLPLANIWTDSEKVIFIQSDGGPSMADWAMVVVACCSVFVAVLALILSTIKFFADRKHSRKLVEPSLGFSSSLTYDDFEYYLDLVSYGLGPAKITSVEYSLGDDPFIEWKSGNVSASLIQKTGLTASFFSIGTLDDGFIINTKESFRLLQLRKSVFGTNWELKLIKAFYDFMGDVKVVVKYNSIYPRKVDWTEETKEYRLSFSDTDLYFRYKEQMGKKSDNS